jgi:hypothetical protein
MIQRERTFDTPKTLETETSMPSCWIPGIFQCLIQEIVISSKIINIHEYANEVIWLTEIQIEEQFDIIYI